MVLRKITIDNSIKHIAKSEQKKEKDSEPKRIKAGSLPPKQNENISQKNKKFHKNIAAGGLSILKKLLKCHFYLKNLQIP